MPILKDCELWFAKLDPKHPNRKFNKKNPTWEVQIRTTNKEQKKQWELAGLSVKAVIPDDGPSYFRVNLRKKTIKADGEAASPVQVMTPRMEPVDPNTIGNGSIGNIRIFQYKFPREDGTQGVASVLMAIQLRKHVVYKGQRRDDDFDMMDDDMEVVEAEENDDDSEISSQEQQGETPAFEPDTPSAPSPSPSPAVKTPANKRPVSQF